MLPGFYAKIFHPMEGQQQDLAKLGQNQGPKVPERLQPGGAQADKQYSTACAAHQEKGPQLSLCTPQQKEKDGQGTAAGPEGVRRPGQPGKAAAQRAQQVIAQGDGGPQQHGLDKRCQRTHPSRRLQKPPPDREMSS